MNIYDAEHGAALDRQHRGRDSAAGRTNRLGLRSHGVKNAICDAQGNRLVGDCAPLNLDAREDTMLDDYCRADIIEFQTRIGWVRRLRVRPQPPARNQRTVAHNHASAADRVAWVLRISGFDGLDVNVASRDK